MAKIITKPGICSTRNKSMGFQFTEEQGGKHSLCGSYSVSGDIIASADALSSNLVVAGSYKGCKLCGNKYVYVCPNCGGITCFDGRAHSNEACPSCGSILNVPAVSGNNLPKPTIVRKTNARTETVQLEQGQIVKIVSVNNQPLSNIEVHVMWEESHSYTNMDVDSSIVVAGRDSYELIYYGDKEHSSGCVIHHGDNLTGGGDGERISVYLDKVPQNRNQIYFVLNIYKCDERGQTLASVRNLSISIYDPDAGQKLIEYKVESNLRNNTAIVLGKAYISDGEWVFKALGNGSNAVTVGDLAREAIRKY